MKYPWKHLRGGRIKCLLHGTITLAGVCEQCVPPSVRQLDHSRGPDADPAAAKAYEVGPGGTHEELHPIPGPTQPLPEE